MYKAYVAEAIGTFVLSFAVLETLSYGAAFPVIVPVVAALTLALFVYTIGSFSGCHINPSVTLAQFSIGKISAKDAAVYIVAQFIGAGLALFLSKFFGAVSPLTPSAFDFHLFAAELIGATFFNFGITAVVLGKVEKQMSGVVVGGSLLLGLLTTVALGAAGILNPAVAFALNSFSVVYVLGPVLGAVLGAQAYHHLAKLPNN